MLTSGPDIEGVLKGTVAPSAQVFSEILEFLCRSESHMCINDFVNSDNDEIVRRGAFLLQELDPSVYPDINRVIQLNYENSNFYVRRFIVNNIVQFRNFEKGNVSYLLSSMFFADEYVQETAVWFLARSFRKNFSSFRQSVLQFPLKIQDQVDLKELFLMTDESLVEWSTRRLSSSIVGEQCLALLLMSVLKPLSLDALYRGSSSQFPIVRFAFAARARLGLQPPLL